VLLCIANEQTRHVNTQSGFRKLARKSDFLAKFLLKTARRNSQQRCITRVCLFLLYISSELVSNISLNSFSESILAEVLPQRKPGKNWSRLHPGKVRGHMVISGSQDSGCRGFLSLEANVPLVKRHSFVLVMSDQD
jgi:hypothetical protein